MYLSTKLAVDTIINRLNSGLSVIVTDGTVSRKVEKAEIYDNVLSMDYTLDGIKKCVEVHTDDFDNGKFGTVEHNGVLYVAPQWWINI